MANDSTIKLTVHADVPLGHKVATKPMAKGDTVVEYEHEIGRTIEDIPVGGYVHAHNIKTKRW
jgi:(2R)-sulfolactate sulfo-lyase subunit alpha